MSSHLTNAMFTLIFITLFVAKSYPQACAPLDKDRPLIFITYERMADRKVMLGLHNNTTCALYVRSNGTPTLYRVTNVSNGKTKLEKRSERTAYDLSEGEILGDLVLEFRDVRFDDRRISTTADGDLLSSRRLASGITVYFTVSRSSFTRRVNLVVPFWYEWEENAVPVLRGNAVHQLYFAFPETLTEHGLK